MSTSGSSRLSILTTMMPASTAFLMTGTSAFESAGAMTIASTFETIICSTMRIWCGGIGFVLDAVRDQVELAGVMFLVVLRAGFHREEELVGERLHHERDFRLRRRLCLDEGERRREDGADGERDGGRQDAPADISIHACLQLYRFRVVWVLGACCLLSAACCLLLAASSGCECECAPRAHRARPASFAADVSSPACAIRPASILVRRARPVNPACSGVRRTPLQSSSTDCPSTLLSMMSRA